MTQPPAVQVVTIEFRGSGYSPTTVAAHINFSTFLITMQQVFPSRSGLPTDNVILGPKSINPKADNLKEFNKFKLYGKQYIQYKALIKKLKATKQRTSLI